MIRYNPKLWVTHIFRFAKSDTLTILWKELVLLAIVTTGLTYVEINYFSHLEMLTELTSVYSLVGFVLSLLLVFRTNTAYDRWWEGRKKWGQLVNDSRNLSVKVASLTDDKVVKSNFAKHISNYAFVMKEHLREGVTKDGLEGTDEEIDEILKASHPPSIITRNMYNELKQLKSKGELSQEEYLTLDQNINSLIDVVGACERIKNTPIPYSYSLFLKKFIFAYVTTLPLAFITTFGYGTALIAVFVFYVLVSIEILAEEIEDPFGRDDNDLPTDDLSRKIKDNVTAILT